MKDAIATMKQGSLILLLIFAAIFWTVSDSNAYLKGDVDGDDRITLTEALHSLQVLTGLRDATATRTINVPDDIPTIQEAIDNAAQGDTIRIAEGTFIENLVITKSDLTFEGAGLNATTIQGSATQEVILLDGARQIYIRDLSVQGGSIGISGISGASFAVQNIRVTGADGHGIRATTNTMAFLEDCAVDSSGGDGVKFQLNASGVMRGTIESNNNGGAGLHLQMTSSLILDGASAEAAGVPLVLNISNNGGAGIAVSDSSSLFSYGATVSASGNQNDGVQVMGGSRLRLVFSDNWTVSDGGRRGMLIFGASDCNIASTSSMEVINGKQRGIYLLNSSSLYADGTVTVTGTTQGDGFGILVEQSSSLFFNEATVNITNNQGSSADGINVRRSSSFSIIAVQGNPVTISSNGQDGIGVYQHSMALVAGPNISVNGNGRMGVYGDDGSSVQIHAADIASLYLRFGARGTLFDSRIDPDQIFCEGEGVMIRGDRACP